MFTPLPVHRVRIQVLTEDAIAASFAIARAGVMDPETVAAPEGRLREYPAAHYRDVYADAKSRLAKLWPRKPGARRPQPAPAGHEELAALERLDHRLRVLWRVMSAYQERRRAAEEEAKNVAQLQESLRMFAALDVDLSLLQGSGTFLGMRLGTLPHVNLPRLSHALTLASHFVTAFNRRNHLDYVIVVGPADAAESVDALLKAADFHSTTIPPEFRDYPNRIGRELETQRNSAAKAMDCVLEDIEAFYRKHAAELVEAEATLRAAAPFAALATRLRGEGGLSVVEGWVPTRRLANVEGALRSQFGKPYAFCSREPRADERHLVPTVMSYPRFLSPFAALVTNYGVPRYGEFDPTWLFSVSFVLMFGMMFGDIGHGLVIAAAGLLCLRRFPRVTPFLVLAGLSSTAFGYLYGSLFGYEDIVHPAWMSPLSDPLLMLELAVYWGIGFITLASLLTIHNLLAEGDLESALLDSRGFAGVVLYLNGVHVALTVPGSGRFDALDLALLLIPLSMILAHKWRRETSPFGERILIVLIEAFESVMNYVANTLSFLRVAAFSLNHVALAIAVFTLAGMMDSVGHWIIVILGNVFIVVVEGAIVTIQVLRLEYYEGFARFFRGDGHRFKPLQLDIR